MNFSPIKHLFRLSLCGIIILALANCKQKDKPALNIEQNAGLPSDFTEFYEKFHSDSIYQMKHIEFPLKGFPNQADSATIAGDNFYWTADTWKIHNMKAFNDSLFTRKFDVPLPTAVNEIVFQKNTPFAMVRRFFKKGDDWYLIYYSAMNPMSEN